MSLFQFHKILTFQWTLINHYGYSKSAHFSKKSGRKKMIPIPLLGPVHMIPGQLIAPGQLIDPGVKFASVHGLTPVTVHMSLSLLRGNFERRVTLCTTPGNPPCRGNFPPCEQNAKVAPRQEQSCTCLFLMFRINFPIKSSRKHQKYVNVFKIHSL